MLVFQLDLENAPCLPSLNGTQRAPPNQAPDRAARGKHPHVGSVCFWSTLVARAMLELGLRHCGTAHRFLRPSTGRLSQAVRAGHSELVDTIARGAFPVIVSGM
mmetsp:Transcript_21001/g.66923  ORF Transcript_21001/g.66923 Transcript_21001/m.66923 type:complete len:104 (+) Transcript_21001:3368-3679(+)